MKRDIMSEKIRKNRINAYISKKNYESIDDLMKNENLISMRLSKGAILDLALSNFFNALKVESLESLAIQHLERIENLVIEENIKKNEGVHDGI